MPSGGRQGGLTKKSEGRKTRPATKAKRQLGWAPSSLRLPPESSWLGDTRTANISSPSTLTPGRATCPIRVQFSRPIKYRRATRAPFFDFNNGKPRQMAGFARCFRCDRVLTSAYVDPVPALGPLPAAFRLFVVACSNCRVALGTSIIGPARTGARSRFHGASLAKTHPRRRQPVGETVRRLLEDEGAEAQPLFCASLAALDDPPSRNRP